MSLDTLDPALKLPEGGDIQPALTEEASKEAPSPTAVETPAVEESPTVAAPATSTVVPGSLTHKMITVMEKGFLDPAPDEPVRAPTTSRQWSNRKAKKEAERFRKNPNSDFSNIEFQDIWANVLRSEGGYANNPADPGGETNFGISKRSYPHENIRGMTADRAQEIFKSDFFDAVGGETLMKINPGLAAHVSDMAFNAGPKTAIKLMYDAVGMKRESQITPELVDKLSNSEDLVKDYSVARLKYYSGLANAPTFIKGWTNRVNNLNKALNVKTGLNGAYKAARNLDVEALVQHAFSAQEQLAPRFAELNDQELERLRRANEMLSPGYHKPSPQPLQKTTSSVGDVFKATYDAKYYTNTVDGMNELALRAARDASEANRKVLGDKFDKSLVEKMTFGLYGGVNTISDWEKEVADFKRQHPEVKLPYESASQVYEMAHRNAKQIEDRYNALDTGNFKDGVSASLSKLGKVALGYLPGEVLGSMSDRLEGAVNLAPLPGVGTVGGVAKGMLAAFLGTGAAQSVVQPKRQELGLEGGAIEGLTNAAAAGLGQGVLGGLAGLAAKLWRSGSKEAAKETFKAVNNLKAALAAEEPTPDIQHTLREADLVQSQAKELLNNPYGDSVEAKNLYEANRANAMSDLLEGKPVREMQDAPVTNVLDNSDKLLEHAKIFAEDFPDPEAYMAAQAKGIKEWTDFKKSQADPNAKIVEEAANKEPVYKDISEFEPQAKFKSDIEQYMANRLTDVDKRYEETLKHLETRDQATKLDMGDAIENRKSVGEVLQDFKETRTGLSEMFSCMTGGPDKASSE